MKGAQISYVDDTAFPIPPGAPQEVVGSVCDDPFHVTGGGAAYASSLSTIETRVSSIFPVDAAFDPTDPGETVPDDRMDYQVTNGNPVAGGKVHRFRICVSGSATQLAAGAGSAQRSEVRGERPGRLLEPVAVLVRAGRVLIGATGLVALGRPHRQAPDPCALRVDTDRVTSSKVKISAGSSLTPTSTVTPSMPAS